MKRTLIQLVVVILMTYMCACKGDSGDAGPIGPQGSKGESGERGPAGPQGLAGVNGPAGSTGPKGEKGDTGAVGAAGPQGATGPKGDKGATGDTGLQGPVGETNNVMYSHWIDLDVSSKWSQVNSGRSWRFSSITNLPGYAGRVILVYAKAEGATNRIIPIPDGTYGFEYDIFSSGLIFERGWPNSMSETIPKTFSKEGVLGGFTKLRYVIIPGTEPAGRKSAIDHLDYESVKRYYNLPD